MTMRTGFAPVKDKKQLKSLLLVCVLVATSMAVFLPLTAPEARAQPIEHLGSASAEDRAGAPYDLSPPDDGLVLWDANEDHWIMGDYVVDAGYTLEIPALDFMGDPLWENEITFKTDGTKIKVFGRLITNSDGPSVSTTLFWGGGVVDWKGIYFFGGSEGNITDCTFMDAESPLIFQSDTSGSSRLIAPGITGSRFMDMGEWGVRLLGAKGHTNMENCYFFDTHNSAIGLNVVSTDFNMKNCHFSSHGENKSSLYIRNSKVYCTQSTFSGNNQSGNVVHIDNRWDYPRVPGNSDGTILDRCRFMKGAPGDHFVRVDGVSILMDNCSFDTDGGELSIVANDKVGYPGHQVLRNPTADGNPGFWDDTFDNTTINVTGNSSVTLQWYMDVYVEDPKGNPVDNAPVWVEDRNGNPAVPHSKITDADGCGRGFIVTEFILYNNSVDNFNPFNVSAEVSSTKGYAVPKPMMNMSKEVNVTVPFSLIPNTPPIVSWVTTPIGIQHGNIIIQYMLEDPDPYDDGNLSVEVFFSTDPINEGWRPATQAGGDAPTRLWVNTSYIFIWDSACSRNLENIYNTTVYIQIVPSDRVGNGIPNQTGNFTVDNKAPVLLTGPVITPTNTTALIEWTVDEPADASVWYGSSRGDGGTGDGGTLTDETTGSTGSTLQSVQLTDLQPGRNYMFVINSTDQYGNRFSSFMYSFETEIHIQLYKGWNMISIPPYLQNTSVEGALASIAGQYDAVQAYYPDDPTGDYWKHYRPGKPFGNDLLTLDQIYGLWIHMKNDAVLIPGHKDPTLDPLFSGNLMGLEAGWNFVGYPSVQTRLIDDALKDAFGNPLTYDMVQTYDAITGQWLSYDGSSGSLTKMEMGRGYWIHCPAFTEWQVDYV
jgi:hypothetical protein